MLAYSQLPNNTEFFCVLPKTKIMVINMDRISPFNENAFNSNQRSQPVRLPRDVIQAWTSGRQLQLADPRRHIEDEEVKPIYLLLQKADHAFNQLFHTATRVPTLRGSQHDGYKHFFLGHIRGIEPCVVAICDQERLSVQLKRDAIHGNLDRLLPFFNRADDFARSEERALQYVNMYLFNNFEVFRGRIEELETTLQSDKALNPEKVVDFMAGLRSDFFKACDLSYNALSPICSDVLDLRDEVTDEISQRFRGRSLVNKYSMDLESPN